MSEFQYYEFIRIDGGLITLEERREIKQLSSRARVKGNTASFTYNFGSFKHDPVEVVARYFDAMLHVSGDGEKNLIFKLPDHMVNWDRLRYYENEDGVEFIEIGSQVIISISYLIPEESCVCEYDEESASEMFCRLVGLRSMLLEQDYRVLYLVWIHIYGSRRNDAFKGLPIPDDMPALIPELIAFMEFFDIDYHQLP